jgi:hypothetical protein
MCSVTVNRLESLSNELFLEIFEYIDAYSLYEAFYGLNHRINSLLRLAQLHILYNSSNENKAVWDAISSFFSPSQIRVLSSYDDIDISEPFLSAVKENLYSVRLYQKNPNSLDKIFQHLHKNNQIKCLHVTEKMPDRTPKNLQIPDLLFVNHAHRFISLVNLSLSTYGTNNVPIVSIVFSQLRHLSIKNCYWTTNLVRFLHDNTPNLRSLKFSSYSYMVDVSSELSLKHIHELHMDCPGTISNLQTIFAKFPSLRRLHVGCQDTGRSNIVNGTQWQALIEKYFPTLKQLTIDFNEGVDEEIATTFYTGEFWLTKKVKVKMLVNKTSSRYRLVKTIYFGKQWQFEYNSNP